MSILPDLVAGTFAGFGICAVGHPFDTLKVLLQTQPEKYAGGMLDAARQTVARYGPGGLYRGVASPLVGMGIFNAVQFAVFGAAKAFTTSNGAHPSLQNVAAAAAGTGVVVAFVEGPQDLFKCQMQAAGVDPATGKPRYAGTADCVRTIVRQRGVLGTLQGIDATIARNLIGVTAYFYVYEMARLQMAGGAPVSSLSFLQVMMAGGCGGVGYWVLCYPADIIKTAVQCDAIDPAQRKYKGALGAGGAAGSRERTSAHIATLCSPHSIHQHTRARTPPSRPLPLRHPGCCAAAVGRGRRQALLCGPGALPGSILSRQCRGLCSVRGHQGIPLVVCV
jgi:solute carrier family 25 carnitine/acylcarnitine transporter 20/29